MGGRYGGWALTSGRHLRLTETAPDVVVSLHTGWVVGPSEAGMALRGQETALHGPEPPYPVSVHG